MITLAEAEPVAPPGKPSRRRLWLVLAAVAIVVVGGVVTAVATSLHYLHAMPLSTHGGGWLAPDSAHARDVSAGPYDASVIAPRPGQAQTFEIDLDNSSGVSQTVLGLSDGAVLADPSETAEPETIQVSTSRVFPVGEALTRFTSKPVTIPPSGQYSLRYTVVTARRPWSCARREYVSELSLRVRVGAFTRTEVLHLASIMEIRSPEPPC